MSCRSPERIRAIHGFNAGPQTGGGNATYLIQGREPTLVDAATGDPRHLEGLIAALEGASLVRVVVTHSHPDHASGAAALARRWPEAEFWKMPRPERDTHDVVWRELRPNDVIVAGDTCLRVVHTPGHSPDHLCFFDEVNRVLFCGDLLVQGHMALNPPSRGGNLTDYLRSLEIACELRPRRILPAHGPEIDNLPDLVRQYVTHCTRRSAAIVAHLQSGDLTCDAITERLYGAVTAERKHAARDIVLAHLFKLREEGAVTLIGDLWSVRCARADGLNTAGATPMSERARAERPADPGPVFAV